MQVRIESIRLGVAVAAALLAGASVVSAQENTQAPAAAPAASACTLTLDPQALKPSADPMQVKATLSQSIGDAMAAEIQEPNSGIDVALVPAGNAQAAGPSAPSAKKTRVKKPAAGAQAAPAPAGADASAAAGQVVNLRLSAAAAKAGDYTLALKGAAGSCTGKITLEGAEPAAAPTPTPTPTPNKP